jgi:hypothetical protein
VFLEKYEIVKIANEERTVAVPDGRWKTQIEFPQAEVVPDLPPLLFYSPNSPVSLELWGFVKSLFLF